MTLNYHPEYDLILAYVKKNIDILTYSELIEMIYLKFNFRLSGQEVLIYHLKKNGIVKIGKGKCRTKHIRGLRRIYERNMFKLKDLEE